MLTHADPPGSTPNVQLANSQLPTSRWRLEVGPRDVGSCEFDQFTFFCSQPAMYLMMSSLFFSSIITWLLPLDADVLEAHEVGLHPGLIEELRNAGVVHAVIRAARARREHADVLPPRQLARRFDLHPARRLVGPLRLLLEHDVQIRWCSSPAGRTRSARWSAPTSSDCAVPPSPSRCPRCRTADLPARG